MKQENSNPEISPQEAKKEGVGNFMINSLTNPSPVRIFIIALILLNYKFWIILFSGGLSVYEKFEFISLYYLNCESFDIKELKSSPFPCWDWKGFFIFIFHLLVKIVIAFLISIAQPVVLYTIKLLSTKVAKKVSDAEYMTQYNAIEKMVKQYEDKIANYYKISAELEEASKRGDNDGKRNLLATTKQQLAAELFIPKNATEENKNNIFEIIKSTFQLPDLKSKVEQIINLKSSVIEEAKKEGQSLLFESYLSKYYNFLKFINQKPMKDFLEAMQYLPLYEANGRFIALSKVTFNFEEKHFLTDIMDILFISSGFSGIEINPRYIISLLRNKLMNVSRDISGNISGRLQEILQFSKEDIETYFPEKIEFFGDAILKSFNHDTFEQIKGKLEKSDWFYFCLGSVNGDTFFTPAGECVLEYIEEKLKHKEA